MSLVYLAENLNMGRRKEALKILNDSQMRQIGARERFDQEIAVAAQLHHSNVVTAFNSMRLPSLTVFAMQYVEGQNLDQYVCAKGALRIATACAIIRQVAAGLQYAMEMRTIHRDIKPANLMLTKVGTKDVVKILDFGLAKAQMESETQVALTSTGTGMGTPQFMAPEQLRSAATVDIRADIYSLGCTLYFLLTGKPPFTGTHYEIYHAHQSQEPPALKQVRNDVPDALAAIVAKMMAKEPSKRFQRPDEVAVALTPFLEIKSPVPAHLSGVNVASGSMTSANALQKDPQFESVPPAEPAIRNAPLATQIESIPVVTMPIPKPSPVPRAQTADQPRKPVSWKKLIGGGLFAFAAFGFIATMLILSIRTPNGTIVFQQLPSDAEVMVDGETVIVSWDGNRESATVTVKPGTRNVEVRRAGIKVEGSIVSVSSGEKTHLVVRSEQPTSSSPVVAVNPSPVNPSPVSPADDLFGTPNPTSSTGAAPPKVDSPPSTSSGDTFTNSIGMKFVKIRAGTFTMGSPESEPERHIDEIPHEVTLTQDYFLGKYEVTQEEYETVMGFNPSYFKGKRLPVEQVTWYDAAWFCNQVSERDGRKPYYTISGVDRDGQTITSATVSIQRGANGYRLPTEAEWEYACRAGQETPFSFGANISPLEVNYDGDYLYNGAAEGIDRGETVEVDSLPANRFGIHQMHGNVWEWCWDFYGDYPSGSTTDPFGASSGLFRVNRGGSWNINARDCRSAGRCNYAPGNRYESLGFRMAVGL